MPILLMTAWLVFNGRVTLELVLVGLGLTAALYGGCCALLGFSWRRELRLWRLLPGALGYLLVLVREVLLANLRVMGVILTPGRARHTDHRLVEFRAPVKTAGGRLILANSITLTPGTITVSLSGGHYCVHALDERFAHGLEDSAFVRGIRGMEGRLHD